MSFSLLQNATTNTNSQTFRPNQTSIDALNSDRAYLAIYGTFGTCSLILKYQALDGNFYPTGDTINSIGLYFLPLSSEIVLRLDYTAGGASNISAAVIVKDKFGV